MQKVTSFMFVSSMLKVTLFMFVSSIQKVTLFMFVSSIQTEDCVIALAEHFEYFSGQMILKHEPFK